ncbi:MAG: hypothetical protein ABI887_22285 [Burkholderiales bacterium]
MNRVDRLARKQVLLTRIAFTRNELRRDVTQLKRAVQVPQLLRAALGQKLGGTLLGAGIQGDWLTTGLAWLRRYRVAAALVGGVTPLLRSGGRWRRLLRFAVIAGAGWLGWLGWRVVRDRAR